MNAVVAVIRLALIPVALIVIATVSPVAAASAGIGACSSATNPIAPAEVGNVAGGNAEVGFAACQLGCIPFLLPFHR